MKGEKFGYLMHCLRRYLDFTQYEIDNAFNCLKTVNICDTRVFVL